MEKQCGNAEKASASWRAMEFLVPEEVEFIEVAEEGLCQWEFVNLLDGLEVDDDDDGKSPRVQEFDSWDASISWSRSPSEVDELIRLDGSRKEDNQFDEEEGGVTGESLQLGLVVGMENRVRPPLHPCDRVGEGNGFGVQEVVEQENEEEDGYGDDGDDLNDELVPWSVSNKFERQRMRKLGKRAFPKMNHSKRSPYLYLKPGCICGKHGLGLKQAC